MRSPPDEETDDKSKSKVKDHSVVDVLPLLLLLLQMLTTAKEGIQ